MKVQFFQKRIITWPARIHETVDKNNLFQCLQKI